MHARKHYGKHGPNPDLRAAEERVDNADSHYNGSTDKGTGLANIQPGKGNLFVNTDRAIWTFNEGPLSQLDEQYSPKIWVEKISVKNANGDNVFVSSNHPLRYTKVTLLADNNSKRVFYTHALPDQLVIEPNQSITHLRIRAPASNPWFTRKDLENSISNDYTSFKSPAWGIYTIYGFDIRDQGNDMAVMKRELSERRRVVFNSLTGTAEEMQAGYTEEANFIEAMKAVFPPTHREIDPSGKTFVLNRRLDEQEARVVSRYRWFANRPLAAGSIRDPYAAVLNALRDFNMDGGVSLGVYSDTSGHTRTGFRIFTVGEHDASFKLNAAASKYLYTLCQAEAEIAGDPDLTNKLYDKESQRLRNLYKESDNRDKNGVVDLRILHEHALASGHGMDGDVSIIPALFAVADNSLGAVKTFKGDDTGALKRERINETLMDLHTSISAANNSIVATLEQRIHDALHVDTEAIRDEHKQFTAMAEQWIPLVQSYDYSLAKLDTSMLDRTVLRGWLRLAKTPTSYRDDMSNLFRHGRSKTAQRFEFVFIPPTVVGPERAEIIKNYSAKGYNADAGNSLYVDNAVRAIFNSRSDATAKIALSPTHEVNLTAAIDAAAKYLSAGTSEQTIDKLQHEYKFTEHRPAVRDLSEVDRAEKKLITYLNDLNVSTTGKAYKQMTKRMTEAFRTIFADGLNTDAALQRTLMNMGEIHLPEEGITVLFGPSGALYKVVDYKGARPKIVEIPTRAFAGDSLYMRVIKRLYKMAQTGDTYSHKARFTAGNAFNFKPGTADNTNFTKWADKILTNLEDIRADDWSNQLRGMALYSKLRAMTNSEFVKSAKPLENVPNVDAALQHHYTVVTQDLGATSQVAEEAYNDVVKYVQNHYAKFALEEDQFRKYSISDEVKSALATRLAEEQSRLITRLNERAGMWKDIEYDFSKVVAGTPGVKQAVMSVYERERRAMKPTLLSKLIDGMTHFIGKVYARFVEGIASVFDIFNPVKILSSLHTATHEAIMDAVRVLFTTLFNSFLDTHFKNCQTGKRWASDVLRNMDVKIYNTHERKLLAKLQGTELLAHTTKIAQLKDAEINAQFDDVQAGAYTKGSHAVDALKSVFRGPDLALPANKSYANDVDDDQFDIVYQVHTPSNFSSDNPDISGGFEFDQLQNPNTLDVWWRKVGFDLLFPTFMKRGKGEFGQKDTNAMTRDLHEKYKAQLGRNLVKVDNNSIRIKMRLGAFGIKTEDAWGTKKDINRAERELKTQEEKDRQLAAKEFRHKQTAEEQASKQKRTGNPIRDAEFNSGSRTVRNPEEFDTIFNTD